MLNDLYSKRNRLYKKLAEATKLSNLLKMEKNVYSSFPDFGYVVDDTSTCKDKIMSRNARASKNKISLDYSIIPSIRSAISEVNQAITDEQNKSEEDI